MSIKILTKNSIDNTNIDGARQNHFSAGMRSGIVKGAFNEGKFFASASNIIALDSCELRISGHQVVIDSTETITLNDRPSTPTKYSMIAEIQVNDSSVPSFRLFIQPANVELKKDNLFKTNNGKGTYQLRIGNFTLNTDGNITDVFRTTDIITGGGEGGIADIKFNATATQLSSSSKPDVNIDYNEETGEYDAHFGIPAGGGTRVTIGGVEQPTWSADPVYQLSNPNLLINGDFRVNQRGQTSYAMKEGSYAKQYTLDRWYISASGTQANKGSVTIESDGILLTSNVLYGEIGQYIEDWEILKGKTVTLSCKTNNAKGFRLIAYAGNTQLAFASIETELTSVTFNIPNDLSSSIRVLINNGTQAPTGSIKIYYMKLEIGSVATALSPRPYAEELAMCQRYFQNIRIHTSSCPNSTTTMYVLVNLPVTMRTSPTINITAMPSIRGDSTSTTSTSVVVNKIVDNGIILLANATGLKANIAYTLINGEGSLDAEVY